MPRAFAMPTNSTSSGWIVGSPPENWTTSGSPLGGHEAVEHQPDLRARQREAVRLMAGIGETDRAVEVAAAVDLDQGEAGVLFVLRGRGRSRAGSRL
jgi:hypothetical protein